MSRRAELLRAMSIAARGPSLEAPRDDRRHRDAPAVPPRPAEYAAHILAHAEALLVALDRAAPEEPTRPETPEAKQDWAAIESAKRAWLDAEHSGKGVGPALERYRSLLGMTPAVATVTGGTFEARDPSGFSFIAMPDGGSVKLQIGNGTSGSAMSLRWSLLEDFARWCRETLAPVAPAGVDPALRIRELEAQLVKARELAEERARTIDELEKARAKALFDLGMARVERDKAAVRAEKASEERDALRSKLDSIAYVLRPDDAPPVEQAAK